MLDQPSVLELHCPARLQQQNNIYFHKKLQKRRSSTLCDDKLDMGFSVVLLVRDKDRVWLGMARRENTREGLGMEPQGGPLLGIAVLLPALCRPHFLEAGLHFLQDLGGVPHHQLHRSLRCLEQFNCLLVVLPLHTLEKQRKCMLMYYNELQAVTL